MNNNEYIAFLHKIIAKTEDSGEKFSRKCELAVAYHLVKKYKESEEIYQELAKKYTGPAYQIPIQRGLADLYEARAWNELTLGRSADSFLHKYDKSINKLQELQTFLQNNPGEDSEQQKGIVALKTNGAQANRILARANMLDVSGTIDQYLRQLKALQNNVRDGQIEAEDQLEAFKKLIKLYAKQKQVDTTKHVYKAEQLLTWLASKDAKIDDPDLQALQGWKDAIWATVAKNPNYFLLQLKQLEADVQRQLGDKGKRQAALVQADKYLAEIAAHQVPGDAGVFRQNFIRNIEEEQDLAKADALMAARDNKNIQDAQAKLLTLFNKKNNGLSRPEVQQRAWVALAETYSRMGETTKAQDLLKAVRKNDNTYLRRIFTKPEEAAILANLSAYVSPSSGGAVTTTAEVHETSPIYDDQLKKIQADQLGNSDRSTAFAREIRQEIVSQVPGSNAGVPKSNPVTIESALGILNSYAGSTLPNKLEYSVYLKLLPKVIQRRLDTVNQDPRGEQQWRSDLRKVISQTITDYTAQNPGRGYGQERTDADLARNAEQNALELVNKNMEPEQVLRLAQTIAVMYSRVNSPKDRSIHLPDASAGRNYQEQARVLKKAMLDLAEGKQLADSSSLTLLALLKQYQPHITPLTKADLLMTAAQMTSYQTNKAKEVRAVLEKGKGLLASLPLQEQQALYMSAEASLLKGDIRHARHYQEQARKLGVQGERTAAQDLYFKARLEADSNPGSKRSIESYRELFRTAPAQFHDIILQELFPGDPQSPTARKAADRPQVSWRLKAEFNSESGIGGGSVVKVLGDNYAATFEHQVNPQQMQSRLDQAMADTKSDVLRPTEEYIYYQDSIDDQAIMNGLVPTLRSGGEKVRSAINFLINSRAASGRTIALFNQLYAMKFEHMFNL
ncbi:MAG: hypothetical protein WC838_07935, partial [Candidatus Margulisiibacteriota bacterium]